jgi:4-methylaminobutanoate oxidase (formaldehyde-forming)
MKDLSDDDFSNENFNFGTAKYININQNQIWIQRLSYVGELGFELYIQTSKSKEIYNLIVDKGKKHQLNHCGMHAMDIMRMESGYLHWGHDISPEENQYQAGLNFAISLKKDINFIGKDSLLKIKEKKIDKRLVMLSLMDSKPGEPLLLHDEPIYLKDKIIGVTTSGNFSFNFNKNLSFGYINSDLSDEQLNEVGLYVEIEKKKYQAELHSGPLKHSNFKTD